MEDRITLPYIAAKVATWFPELEGRAVAVMDDDITATTAPTLPMAMVMLNNIATVGAGDIQTVAKLDLIQDIAIEFWFSPDRYKKIDRKTDSPFWAYRDFYSLMDRLIVGMRDDFSDLGSIEFVSMEPGTTELAVMFEFRFRITSAWCEPENCDIKNPDSIVITACVLPFNDCGCDGDNDGSKDCGSNCP